jgi:hypothetical protein
MYDRILHYLELHFGRSGSARVVEGNDLKYLIFEGGDFDIAVRNKKLDEYFLSCNYPTDQQVNIRKEGVFSWMKKPTIQIFLGYRLSGGLQRSLSHVMLTHENLHPVTGHRQVEWIETLWTEQEGVFPFRDTQNNFLTPPAPAKVKGRKVALTDMKRKKRG